MTKLTRTFKRKGGARRRLNFSKKRRVVRRGRRSNAFTSQSGSGGGIRFRSKKTSRRVYNRMLWNSSLLRTHYRSNSANVFSVNTPATANNMTVVAQDALSVGGGAFWTAGGGAISPDASNALPTFTGDILLRGGMIGLRLANTFDTTDALRNTLQGTVMLIRTTKGFAPASMPSTVNVGWDPTFVQDFNTKIGRIVYKRDFLLRDADTTQVQYRLKIRKLDQADYFSRLNELIWVIVVGTVDINSVRGFTYSPYYNVSFTADGV